MKQIYNTPDFNEFLGDFNLANYMVVRESKKNAFVYFIQEAFALVAQNGNEGKIYEKYLDNGTVKVRLVKFAA